MRPMSVERLSRFLTIWLRDRAPVLTARDGGEGEYWQGYADACEHVERMLNDE